MHSTLITPNLKPPNADVASGAPRKSLSAPPEQPERSFHHALGHAQKANKPAESNATSAKAEKLKSQKGGAKTAKPGANAATSLDPKKKTDKPASSTTDDSDSDEPSSDAHRDQDADPDAQKRKAAAQSTNDEDKAESSDDADADQSGDHVDLHHAQDPTPAATTAKPQNPANRANELALKNTAKPGVAAQLSSPLHPQEATVRSGTAQASSTQSLTNGPFSRATTAPLSTVDKTAEAKSLSTTAAQPVSNDTDGDADATDQADAIDSSADAADAPLASAAVSGTAASPASSDVTSANPAAPSAVAAVGQSTFANLVDGLANTPQPQGHLSTGTAASAKGDPANTPPGARFVADNHPNIVQSVKTQLLPTGGTMKLRLDPPQLGALQVHVQLKNGVMTASFQTSNDQATKMLSHSLGQLKQALEAQGVTVGKMHVQQSAKDQTPADQSADDENGDPGHDNTSSSQQDEQRREALRRMWEKLALGGDPLDLVA
jgi:flagellar hook-length control protein FliK